MRKLLTFYTDVYGDCFIAYCSYACRCRTTAFDVVYALLDRRETVYLD